MRTVYTSRSESTSPTSLEQNPYEVVEILSNIMTTLLAENGLNEKYFVNDNLGGFAAEFNVESSDDKSVAIAVEVEDGTCFVDTDCQELREIASLFVEQTKGL